MRYQVVIPMTGVGQRFVDAGYKSLKPLIHVGGISIVAHVLEMFKGAQKIVCIISAEHEQRDRLVSEILRLRPDATISQIPGHKLGPGHAILQAVKDIDPTLPTLVSYCDWAGEWRVTDMLIQLEDYSGSILTYTGFHPHMMRSTKFAYVRKIDNLVVDIKEKESFTITPRDEEASSGCYGFATGALLLEALQLQLDENENLNGEYYLSLTYKNMLRRGYKVGTVLMSKFYQWGTPEDLQDWEYWNSSINSLPGLVKERLKVHNVILAAGLGTRIVEFAHQSKPNINISGQCLWEYSAPRGIVFESSWVVTREEVGISTRGDIQKVTIPYVTEGQAITAKIGIEKIDEYSSDPVNVLSSDNAFTPEVFALAAELAFENHLVVWTSRMYPLAQLIPNQYAWLNMKLRTVIKKQVPPNFLNWQLVTGNFTFSNRKIALSLIQELENKNIRVKNEFYLDSLIDLAFERELNVATVEIPNFIAIGTPEELLTYQYFKNESRNG
jgi:GTP:adenosylcobinamide-phosphate guanylyltransferase